VGGPSLAEAVSENGPLPTASVLALAAGLAEGLNAIHAAGVVHRDLKPANVLLAADGPRVIDFGISRAAGNSALTHTGLVVGSPGFMSPEQAEGREVGPPSDIFSLGAVLAFAVTGAGPFGSGSTPALVYRVVHSPAQLDRLPAELRPLIERCLAKDPGQRPTAADLLAGRVQPAAGWLPEAVTRTFLAVPALTAPLAPREETGQPPRRENQPARRRPRNRWRLMAATVVIAGLLGAGATAGFALTAAHNPSSHAGRGQTAAGSRIAPAAATSAQAPSAHAPSGQASSPATSGPSYAPANTPPATTAPPSASPTPTAASTSPSPGTSSPATVSSAPATPAPTTSAGY
jgi:serine/threonine protein kinase